MTPNVSSHFAALLREMKSTHINNNTKTSCFQTATIRALATRNRKEILNVRAEDKALLMAPPLQLRQGYLHLMVQTWPTLLLLNARNCASGGLCCQWGSLQAASSSGVHHLSHVGHLLGDVQVKLHVARKVLYCDVIHKGSGLL